jgi:hypothetical protein
VIAARARGAIVLAAVIAAPLPAQTSASLKPAPPPSVTLTTRPAAIVRGTVGLLLVRSASGSGRATLTDVLGTAAGEPLHFERGPHGAFTAIVGVPIEGSDSLPVSLVLDRAGEAAESLSLAVRLAPGSYPRERLRVAEKYVKPDSAAAARIAGEIEQARAVSRQSHESGRMWSAPFAPPRPGRITSRFGTGREFNGAIASRHLGTDFAGAVGAPVRAANRGRVALVASFYLAGSAVYVDHGGGLITGYFHLSRAAVAEGDVVARGQIIGRVGKSGRVTGPHLHWIARYGGITVDPMSLVRLGALPRLAGERK